jgi:Ceramidase
LINRSGSVIGIKPVALSAGLTATAMGAIWALLMVLGPDWSAFAPATCTATRCFCELPRTGSLILQPANSWSSYGYAFAGFLMIVLSQGGNWKSRFRSEAATAFGLTAIFVGLGSVLLHATLTLWGQFFDVMGMYLVSGFMVISAVSRWRGWPMRRAILAYLALVGSLVVLLYLFPDIRRWLFAVVLIAAIVLELGFARPRRAKVRVSYYFAGIATKAVAFTIWNLDQHGTLCAPDSPLQGHAAWHVLGAMSLWFTFLYYRSERAR